MAHQSIRWAHAVPKLCLYLRWLAQPLWGSLSPLPFHSQWPHDVPEAPGTAGYLSKQTPWGEEQSGLGMWRSKTEGIKSMLSPLGRCCCLVGDRPANQAEPGEAVIEGVAASQSVVAILHSATGKLCSAVVHLSHQVQSLPAGGSISMRHKLVKACFVIFLAGHTLYYESLVTVIPKLMSSSWLIY